MKYISMHSLKRVDRTCHFSSRWSWQVGFNNFWSDFVSENIYSQQSTDQQVKD